MRSTSIALSSLAMLLAWKASPVQASPNPPLLTPLADTDQKNTLPQASPQPVAIAAPDSIVAIESAAESQGLFASLEHSNSKNDQVSPDRSSLHSSQLQPAKSAKLEKFKPELSDSKSPILGDLGGNPPTLATQSNLQALSEPAKVEASPKLEASTVSTPKLAAQSIAQTPINPDPTASPIDRAPTDSEPQSLDPQDTQSERGDVEIIDQPAQQSSQQPTQRRQPDVQLLLRSSVFSSSNITALDVLRISDTVFVNSAQLLATPKLGENTRLIASAGGGLTRFATEGDSNYNFLTFNVALQQRLAPGTFGQLGWVQDNLYRSENGDRLLRDNAIQLILGRQDHLGRSLRLDSFYELRAGFANPDDQSRIANTLGTRLRYDITPTLQGALDYRLTFKNFTQVDRSDTEHQLGASMIYNISPTVFVAGSVSYLFGRSSDAAINLSNLSFGLNLGFNVPLF